jgi:tRNA U34 5-methylaminomethyl-2-thiouridine-forming methyltransferase MnmC
MQQNRQIITTEDGSKTIYFPDIDENYHSKKGALQESSHIFLKHGLHYFKDVETISVFEVGFGTGLNALLSMQYSMETNQRIIYHTIEAFPILLEEVKVLDYEALFENQIIKEWSQKIHQIPWNSEFELTSNFLFTKYNQKLQEHNLLASSYNCIFFDAFSPRVQNELWTIEIFQKMYDSLIDGGLLVTYCAKGQVKRDLKSVGFLVENVEGPPGKREMTLAWKK